MKKIILFLILFISSAEVSAKQKNNNNPSLDTVTPSTETKPFFKNKDLEKPKNIIIDDDFDITCTDIGHNVRSLRRCILVADSCR